MEKPIVNTSNGKVQGFITKNLDDEDFYAFLGIPYGKDPIGNLRFKAPEPIENWDGVKDCTKDGPRCIQIDRDEGPHIQGSENCLNLNIYTRSLPDSNSELKPVLVYFHGGLFNFGSNGFKKLGPQFLLLEDIVLVIPNFRLGLMGFLKLNDQSLDVPGNAGLKDQVLALQWVQKNIEHFGGDPRNITISGHSSGSVMAHYHLFSPSSFGLFHKLIILSGTVLNAQTHTVEFEYKKFSTVLGLNMEEEKEFLTHLQSLPAEGIIEVQRKCSNLFDRHVTIFAPTVEAPNRTSFITEHPLDMILNGNFHRVPILATYTEKESLLNDKMRENLMKRVQKMTFEADDVLPPWYKKKMNDTDFDKISLEIETVYSTASSSESKMLLESDVNFIMPQIAISQTHAVFSDKPVYLMRWSVNDELNYMKNKLACQHLEGCAHADEIGYIFQIPDFPLPKKGSSADAIVRRAAQILKNFCLHGNPSTDFTGNWKPLQEASTHVLDFGNDVAFVPFPEAERMKLWQKIMDFDKRDTKLTSLKVV